MTRYTATLPAALAPGDPLLSYFATWAAVERDAERLGRATALLAEQSSHVRIARPVCPEPKR